MCINEISISIDIFYASQLTDHRFETILGVFVQFENIYDISTNLTNFFFNKWKLSDLGVTKGFPKGGSDKGWIALESLSQERDDVEF